MYNLNNYRRESNKTIPRLYPCKLSADWKMRVGKGDIYGNVVSCAALYINSESITNLLPATEVDLF